MLKTLWRQSWSSLLWVLLSGCIYGKRIKSNLTMGAVSKRTRPFNISKQKRKDGRP